MSNSWFPVALLFMALVLAVGVWLSRSATPVPKPVATDDWDRRVVYDKVQMADLYKGDRWVGQKLHCVAAGRPEWPQETRR